LLTPLPPKYNTPTHEKQDAKGEQVSAALADWPRKYYQATTSGPMLFFVVFGKFGAIGPVSMSKYRCAGLPEAIDVMKYGGDVHPETMEGFRQGLMWDLAKAEIGELQSTIAQAPECLIVRGELPDQPNLNYLRDVTGFVTYLLDHGGCAVHDLQRLKYWSPAEWRTEVFDPSHDVPLRQTIILVSEEADGTKWFHTRGLRKYGRPDLSVHRVVAGFEDAVHDLLNRFIVLQAEGGIIAEGQEITMKSLPQGLCCHPGGSLDDPDFNNVHIDIGFPGLDGPFGC
jgi:hypothetical protein